MCPHELGTSGYLLAWECFFLAMRSTPRVGHGVPRLGRPPHFARPAPCAIIVLVFFPPLPCFWLQ